MDAFSDVALLGAALTFTVICGMNDGASVVAMAFRAPSVPPWLALAGLVVAVVAAPLVVGTAVATTLAADLGQFDGGGGSADAAATWAVFAALAAASAVVATLAASGLPTSVALALVGALTGAGVGVGHAPDWATLGTVLAVGALSPVVGGVLGWTLARLTAAAYEVFGWGPRPRWTHPFGFALLAVAYGSNGGQKMLAVIALALGLRGATVEADFGRLLLVGAVFTLGLLLGVRRLAGSLGAGVMLVRATHAANSEIAAGAAVLASTALGAPVSLTQATTAALVGAGLSDGRQIRWGHAGGIAAGWLLTLPAAAVLGAAGGALAVLLT